MRPLYRARQFWQGLTAAPLSAEARQLVERILSPAEQQGFDRLAPVDQWHSYQVLRLLQRHGHDEPALLKAALLHDIGKTRAPLSLLDRTVAVLGRLLIPGRAAAWEKRSLEAATRWQRPFVIHRRHPEWSAELLAAAGSDERTIDLVRRHQDRPAGTGENDRLLALLQWADDQN